MFVTCLMSKTCCLILITYTKSEIAIFKKIIAVKHIEFVNYCGIVNHYIFGHTTRKVA